MRGQDPKAQDLDYYPTVEQIFRELTRQAGTKVPIPEASKQVEFSIIEPLTDQEKEEDYELNLYISTFVLEDTPTVPTSWVHLTIKPQTAKVAKSQPIEQQQPTEKTQPIV